MSFDPYEYIKVVDGNVAIRTTVYAEYPRQGFARSGKGATPEEARKFAAAIIAAAEKAEKQAMPEYWPPQSGDLWDASGMYQYFVQGNYIYSKVSDDKQPKPFKYDSIRYAGWKLVYRHGLGVVNS
jgi:hypothetical protein